MLRNVILRVSSTMAVIFAVGAGLIANASSATATQGQLIIAGQVNTAAKETVVRNTNAGTFCTPSSGGGLLGCGTTGLYGSGSATGVYGSGNTTGVYATSETWGVFGTGGDYGVYGTGGTYGLLGAGGDTGVRGSGDTGVYGLGIVDEGVFGETNSDTASGVYGRNNGSGWGVAGRSSDGTGVLAESARGAALDVRGKAEFTRSGIATVKAARSRVDVSGVAMSSTSFILATIQGDVPRTWVRGVTSPGKGSRFTILLNRSVAADTRVAWFVVN